MQKDIKKDSDREPYFKDERRYSWDLEGFEASPLILFKGIAELGWSMEEKVSNHLVPFSCPVMLTTSTDSYGRRDILFSSLITVEEAQVCLFLVSFDMFVIPFDTYPLVSEFCSSHTGKYRIRVIIVAAATY